MLQKRIGLGVLVVLLHTVYVFSVDSPPAPPAPPPPESATSDQSHPHDVAAPPPPHLYNNQDSKLSDSGSTGVHLAPKETTQVDPTANLHSLPHGSSHPGDPNPHTADVHSLPQSDVHQQGPQSPPHPDAHPLPHSDSQAANLHSQQSAGQQAPHAVQANVHASSNPSNTHANQGSSSNSNSQTFSSTSGDGPSRSQCSFTVTNPNTFQASSDNFGYPTFMVEGAANNNPLARELFKKLVQNKNSGGNHFVVPAGASGPSHLPGFAAGGRRIPGIAELGVQAGDPNSQDLDINSMFAKIGKHADNEALGVFPHDTPAFPDHAIVPGRRFGPGSQLQSTFQSHDPFGGGGFGNIQFRKKRQAGPDNYSLGQGFQNQLQTVCPFKSDYIRKFKKYNSECYVYKPELQGRKIATCSQDKCGHCGGSGRCVAEKESAHIWAYCQNGPNARKLEMEYVEYPAYCVCKTIEC